MTSRQPEPRGGGGGAADADTSRQQSRLKGRVLIAAGSALLLIGSLGVFGTRLATSGTGGFLDAVLRNMVVVLIGGGVICGAGGLLYSRGQQYLQASAEEVTAGDSRAPVLYLRSFEDDSVTKSSHLAGSYALGFQQFTEEQELTLALSPAGPVIAVGQPGEQLPLLGAHRLYMDEDWQNRVIELMTRARLVVLRLGTTEGVWWEFEQASARVGPERLLLLVPSDAEDAYEQFRQRAHPHINLPALPDPPARDLRHSRMSVRGALFFGPDWTPHFIDFHRAPMPLMRGSAVRVEFVRKALEPVFAQLR
ncbi:hypothetical protein [Streptomyces sp. A1547]|uniref:hypothetical protein n=1 Tax=Streptomyces sp. A1547 TaxID=2563105 RepID=UPI00109E59FB|nr:hypothetical protein [Streptomyces sp. A1547]THA30533.1 hypothetical protein E6W17_37470 [Streptomyces sp. A1547]